MSFSFTVKAATKDEVRALANIEMGNVIENQSVHARDSEAVLQTLDLYLALLPSAPEGKQYSANVCGSIGWETKSGEPFTLTPEDDQITAVGCSVSVCLV